MKKTSSLKNFLELGSPSASTADHDSVKNFDISTPIRASSFLSSKVPFRPTTSQPSSPNFSIMLLDSEAEPKKNLRPFTSNQVSPNSSQILLPSDSNATMSYSNKACVNRKIKLDIKYQNLLEDMKKIRLKSATLVQKNVEKIQDDDQKAKNQIVKKNIERLTFKKMIESCNTEALLKLRMKKAEEPIRYEYTHNAIKKGREKKYEHIIKQINQIEYEKGNPNKVVKYITNVPINESALMQPIYVSTSKLRPSIEFQSSPIEDKPINLQETIDDLNQIDFVGAVSPKQFQKELNFENNTQQLKMLVGGINLLEKKRKIIKKKEALMGKPDSNEALTSNLELMPSSPSSKHRKKEISKTKAIEERLKFGQTLAEYLKNDSGLANENEGQHSPIFKLSSAVVSPANSDTQLQEHGITSLKERPSPFKKPKFLSPNQLVFPFSQAPSRDNSASLEEKLKSFNINEYQSQSKKQKSSLNDAHARIEQKVHEMVAQSKFGRHIRSPLGTLMKDRTNANIASLISVKTKTQVSTSQPKLNSVKSPTSTKSALQKAEEIIKNGGNYKSEFSKKYKSISDSCKRYILSSTETQKKAKRSFSEIKGDLKKINVIMEGEDYSLEEDIRKQIFKDIDDAASYFLTLHKLKRKTKSTAN